MLLDKRMRALLVSGVLLGPAFFIAPFLFGVAFPFSIHQHKLSTQLSEHLDPLRNAIYCALRLWRSDGETQINVMHWSADLSAPPQEWRECARF